MELEKHNRQQDEREDVLAELQALDEYSAQVELLDEEIENESIETQKAPEDEISTLKEVNQDFDNRQGYHQHIILKFEKNQHQFVKVSDTTFNTSFQAQSYDIAPGAKILPTSSKKNISVVEIITEIDLSLLPQTLPGPESPFVSQDIFSLQDNVVIMNQVAAKSRSEVQSLLDLNQFEVGQIFNTNDMLGDSIYLQVENLATGLTVATLLDSQNKSNGVNSLQAPWHRGNIKHVNSGLLLIVPKDEKDHDGDGLIDSPAPQQSFPSGTISLDFTQPVYEFGWDMFNLEYGYSIALSNVVFTDTNGNTALIPFSSFIDWRSPFYDNTFRVGSSSANRINPIPSEQLGLSDIKSVVFQLSDEIGLANFAWLGEQITLTSNTLYANVFEKEAYEPNTLEITQVVFNFSSFEKAIDFAHANAHLNPSVDNKAVILNQLNQTIVTPLGGHLVLQPGGDLKYIAPIDASTHQDEVIEYHVVNHLSNEQAIGKTTISIQPNIPQANSITNYTTASSETYNYNLVFMLDVSRNMSRSTYNHTQLEIQQKAIVDLIEQYENISDNLKITIIPFSSGAQLDGAFSYHASSSQDAIEFVNKEGAHNIDGLAVQMQNLDTGKSLDGYVQYNDALYHARLSLEQDLTDSTLQDYNHKVYIISGGLPQYNHGATNTQDWPIQWGSWQDFIRNPDIQVQGAYADKIETYAVDIYPFGNLQYYLSPIASDSQHILSPNPVFFELGALLRQTLPSTLKGNLLTNDLYSPESQLKSIQFVVEDAEVFIQEHQLALLGATKDGTNTLIQVPLLYADSPVCVPSPLGGKLFIDKLGNYSYLSPKIDSDAKEIFTYTLYDSTTKHQSNADLIINVYQNEESVTALQGDHQNNILSSEGLREVVTMSGGRGDDLFVIDVSNQDTSIIYIKDFTIGNNCLKFINTESHIKNDQISLEDIFTDFYQATENSNVIIQLNNASAPDIMGTQLILENIGTISGPSMPDLLDHFEQLCVVI